MLGILYIGAFILYLALSIYVVLRASRFSQRRFGRGWLGGSLAALVMYNLIFWDFIPARYTHYRLCNTEAGLKVYQTPEEWAKENPERYQLARAATKRVIARRSNDSSEAIHSWTEFASGLEFEFYHQRKQNYAFHTGVERERVIDKTTKKILFEVFDFYSAAGTKSLAVGASSFADYKFWTVTGRCARAYPSMSDRFKYNGNSFSDFLITMEGWNK